MRTGLIALGLLLLVVGAALYALPGAENRANARGTEAAGTLATVGIAGMLIGALLGLLGLVVPSARYVRRNPRDVQTVEHVATVRDSDGTIVKQTREVEYRK